MLRYVICDVCINLRALFSKQTFVTSVFADTQQCTDELSLRQQRLCHRLDGQRVHHRGSLLAQRLSSEARFNAIVHVTAGSKKKTLLL